MTISCRRVVSTARANRVLVRVSPRSASVHGSVGHCSGDGALDKVWLGGSRDNCHRRRQWNGDMKSDALSGHEHGPKQLDLMARGPCAPQGRAT